jgi:protein-tyrosine-phosphatase
MGWHCQAALLLLTERFAGELLSASSHAEGFIMSGIPEVLFVCVHNAGRSQMAAGLLNKHAHGAVHVRSAGSEPADQLNPAVVEAMREVGVDMSEEFPKKYLDWELEDPAGQGIEAVRPIRDEIDRRVRRLLTDLVPASPTR